MTDETLYCYIHPNRPTTLRCNRCERPICAEDAVLTPTGYRCKNCVREHQKTFDTATLQDYILGFATTVILSLIASGLLAALSFVGGFFIWIIAFFGAAGAGTLMANAVLRVIHNRRSRSLFITIAAGVVIGALPVILFGFFTSGFYSLISQGIYIFVATPAVYTRVAGIQL